MMYKRLEMPHVKSDQQLEQEENMAACLGRSSVLFPHNHVTINID